MTENRYVELKELKSYSMCVICNTKQLNYSKIDKLVDGEVKTENTVIAPGFHICRPKVK